jgi:K+-transporting ATPase ATPase C chain
MLAHLRANLSLLVFTVILCCVLYPLAILAIGQTAFHDKAEGNLVTDGKGHTVGAELIAQPFSSDRYFTPRPSAASFNAAASGASNYSANNPALRYRVMGQLGQVLKYRDGSPVGPDVVKWFRQRIGQDRAILGKWLHDRPGMATVWAGADDKVGAFLKEWGKNHPAEVEKWKAANPDAKEVKPENLAPLFFDSYAQGQTTSWPQVDDAKDIQAGFFAFWWDEHSGADVQPVPADMVTTSGSGLDPHITLANALYQLDGVAAAWAKLSGAQPSAVRPQIEKVLRDHAQSPLGGLVGEPMVNVLEANLAIRDLLEKSRGG